MRIIKALFLITSMLMSAGNAYALSAIVDTKLNVRAGPSTKFHVVDQLRKGKKVRVSKCQKNGWCYVRHFGKNGWVYSKYLSVAPRVSNPTQPLNPWGLFSSSRKKKQNDNGCQDDNCGNHNGCQGNGCGGGNGNQLTTRFFNLPAPSQSN